MLTRVLPRPDAEKAAEVRAQAADATAVRGTSGPADLPADSRSASLHLCGFDIQGVSIAGQVRPLHILHCADRSRTAATATNAARQHRQYQMHMRHDLARLGCLITKAKVTQLCC